MDDYEDDYEVCDHDHDEECLGPDGRATFCTHEHCAWCGACGCPGYCDDYQTYNLRGYPEEAKA
jgi:hypothetical protein